MKTMKSLAVIALVFGLAATAQAQELKTANFLDNYLYGYRLNPSVTPTGTTGFVGIGTGNISLNGNTNFGASNFLFPLDNGKLVTGFNSAVSESQFPGGMEEMNRFNARLSENILAIGVLGKKGGYGHFELNLVSEESIGIPRSLFEAFKSKNTTGHYQVDNINFNTTNYLELAYGRAKRSKNLAIGWTIKGLIGVAKADASVDMEINPAGESMWLKSQGTLKAAAPILAIGINSDGYYDPSKIGLNPNGIKPSGLGIAVDIGASYYLLKDKLILGASVRNLGGMKWTTDLYGQNSGNKVVVDMNNTDKMSQELKEMLQFKPVNGDDASKFERLPISYNLSAKFKPISLVTLGVVGTFYNYKGYSTKDIRFGAALTPFRQLNIAGTYAFGETGNEIGVAASVRLLGINLYAGVDAIQYRVTPQYIPVDPVTAMVNAGVAIAFGKSKASASKDKAKQSKNKKSSKKGGQAEPEPLPVLE